MRKIIQKVNAHHGVKNNSLKELDGFIFPHAPGNSFSEIIFSRSASANITKILNGGFGKKRKRPSSRPRTRIKDYKNLNPGIVGDISEE